MTPLIASINAKKVSPQSRRLKSMNQFDAVENWLNTVACSHSQSKATEEQYKRVWKRFASYTGETADQILAEYEVSDDRTFRRKYAQCIRTWIADLVKEGLGITSIKVMVGVVKSFFKYNDLPLGIVPQSMSGVIYRNRDIKREERHRRICEGKME